MSQPIILPTGPHVNPALIEVAERLLADVRAGRVSTFAAIVVTPLGQISAPAVGPNATELYVGCDMLKAQILGAMTGARPGLKI